MNDVHAEMSEDSFTSVPVLFLDIDGTVRQGKDDALGRFVNSPEDVHVFPEAVERMRAWKEMGGRIVGVSNQGGIALGIVTPRLVYEAMEETYQQCDGLFDELIWCSHHPNAKDLAQARCWCRKPRPGLAIEAATLLTATHQGEKVDISQSMFVGDRPEDRICASHLNVNFMWAWKWRAGYILPESPPLFIDD